MGEVDSAHVLTGLGWTPYHPLTSDFPLVLDSKRSPFGNWSFRGSIKDFLVGKPSMSPKGVD